MIFDRIYSRNLKKRRNSLCAEVGVSNSQLYNYRCERYTETILYKNKFNLQIEVTGFGLVEVGVKSSSH